MKNIAFVSLSGLTLLQVAAAGCIQCRTDECLKGIITPQDDSKENKLTVTLSAAIALPINHGLADCSSNLLVTVTAPAR
jgi:hypothetical protein